MSERTKRLNYLNPCYVGKKIEKELNLNRISNEDNEIFRKFVNSVIIKYVIKPQKIGLKEYKTDQEDYSEIQIIEININNYRYEMFILYL